MRLQLTPFSKGTKKSNKPTEYCKDILWGDTLIGCISKIPSYSAHRGEYRVYYYNPNFEVTESNTDNKEEMFVLMDCFPSLPQAEVYVEKHFADNKALRQEMFNVYVKLLQPLGV